MSYLYLGSGALEFGTRLSRKELLKLDATEFGFDAACQGNIPETGANHNNGGGIYLRREPIISTEGGST
eukprot:3176229-Pyramimonas_sp.AAC.1